MNRKNNFALVTVTSENYVQWTMVMIHSFLRSNEWFAGDIVVFCTGLSQESIVRLQTFKQVNLMKPDERLLKQIEFLVEKIPQFKNIQSQFYSIELFNLPGYQKVLFLDSDLIVVKSVQELFMMDLSLVACPESCWYQGKGRNALDYDAVEIKDASDDFIETPINSGFLFVGEQKINSHIYNALVDMVKPELWSNKNTFHADQMVINLWFCNQFTIFDSRYNYRPKNAEQIRKKDRVKLDDAFIIHFVRQYKPWLFNEMLKSSEEDLNFLQAYEIWYAYYFDFLKNNHLRKKVAVLKSNSL